MVCYTQSYIKGCHICQLSRYDKLPMRQLQTRINLNDRPLSRLSRDVMVMPRSYEGHKYILCIIDKVTKYLITLPIHQSGLEKIGNALIENVISKYCVSDYIIMDQDSALMSLLINYLSKKLDIKIKTVAPYNHQSLANYSPYKLVFGKKPELLLDLETAPDIKVLGTFKDYYTLLNKRLQYLHKLLQDFRYKRLAMINKDIIFLQYNSGDLVYIISPLTSQLRTSSRKVTIKM